MSEAPLINPRETSPATRPPAQFTTRTLFVLTAAIAMCIWPVAAWGEAGVLTTAPLVLFLLLNWRSWNGRVASVVLAMLLINFGVVTYSPSESNHGNWVVLLIFMLTVITGLCLLRRQIELGKCVFLVMAMLTMFVPYLRPQRPSNVTAACANNMKQFGIALHSYHNHYGHFPPPYTTDKDGKPLHSWRVLLLPFLGETKLYEQIDLTKPWHHPENLALAEKMPEVYRCWERRMQLDRGNRRQPDEVDVTTAYVAILGEHTAWPRNGKRTIKEIVDGTASTLMIAESEKHRIHWMSTADPGIETLGPTEGDGETLLAHRPHRHAFHCVLCDGSVGEIPPEYSFEDFLSLLTIDGGERHKLPE